MTLDDALRAAAESAVELRALRAELPGLVAAAVLAAMAEAYDPDEWVRVHLLKRSSASAARVEIHRHPELRAMCRQISRVWHIRRRDWARWLDGQGGSDAVAK